MHRLQPVARVGQRPVHDRGQRIGEVALLQRVPEVDDFARGFAGRRRSDGLCHEGGLQERRTGGKFLFRTQAGQHLMKMLTLLPIGTSALG